MRRIAFVGVCLVVLIMLVSQMSEGQIRTELRNCILNEFQEGEISVKIEGYEKD